MTKLDELKAGGSCEYRVSECTLFIEPIPYGRLKKLLALVLGKINTVVKLDTKQIMEQVPILFDENLPQLVELMFDKKKHSFLNIEWVNENVTLVHMQDIFEGFVRVTGLQDFLGKKVQKPKEPEGKILPN